MNVNQRGIARQNRRVFTYLAEDKDRKDEYPLVTLCHVDEGPSLVPTNLASGGGATEAGSPEMTKLNG